MSQLRKSKTSFFLFFKKNKIQKVIFMARREEKIEENEEDVEVKPIKPGKDYTIEDLPGVGAATAAKLKETGYIDLMSVAVASPGELVDIAGVSESTARKMIQFARDSLEMGFESGIDLLKRRSLVCKITTGSKAIDQMLGGGMETGAITETYGTYGSSKTQLAHQMSVMIQKPKDKGGAEGIVVYIDTENTFRPERIQQIATAHGMDPEQVLQNIKVARAYNSDHQILLAEKVNDLIKKHNLNVKLVIVDSLTAHFRAEFIGRGTLADRQQKINRHMHTLMKLADTYNLAVYVTNQVMTRPDVFFGDPTEAIGGNIVGHNSTFRIYVRRGKKGTRVAKLVDSPHLPEGECAFIVTDEGIKDI
jgi:DNA repair protein RadA